METMETERNLNASIPGPLLARAEEAASAEHISVDEWLRSAVEQRLRSRATATTKSQAEVFRPAVQLTFEERRQHFRNFLASAAGNTVVLPDEAMEREAIYGELACKWSLHWPIPTSFCV